MSASEKLKALEAALGGEDADVGIPLPQIVAVVEAAETLYAEGASAAPLWDEINAALTALDEALS